MKQFELHILRRSITLAMLLQFFVSSNDLLAQNSWAMATIEEGKSIPTITEYHCKSERASNRTYYNRIYDESYRIRRDGSKAVRLPYGYRMADRCIYIYDFDANEERLAFDFTLSTGDHFTTFNGMEWLVEATIDTLVNVSYKGQGEPCNKRLLKVVSTDGQYTDEWLEDYGSLSNHFMILPMTKGQLSQTLWMEYESGCYLAREFSADPLFARDSKEDEIINNIYWDEYETIVEGSCKNGILEMDFIRWGTPNREYICNYRVGDDLYIAYWWRLKPYTDTDLTREAIRTESFTYTGLPTPKSGQFALHLTRNDRPSNETAITNTPANNSWGTTTLYDLQGRQLQQKPSKGLYIQGGKKVAIK